MLWVSWCKNKSFWQRFTCKTKVRWRFRKILWPSQNIWTLQVNLCQKLLFLHQLTHNMTTDCSLNYKFNTWKFQAQTWGEHVVYRNCFRHSEQILYTRCSHRFELGIFMFWTCNSMNNLLSYCGLVDAEIRASDKDLPLQLEKSRQLWSKF